jgi:hypothetical protein
MFHLTPSLSLLINLLKRDSIFLTILLMVGESSKSISQKLILTWMIDRYKSELPDIRIIYLLMMA